MPGGLSSYTCNVPQLFPSSTLHMVQSGAANGTHAAAGLQEAMADIAKTQELAAKAAAATDLHQLSEAVDKLKTSIPDREEMEKAVKQIKDLQSNGLSALDDVGQLKSELTGLQGRVTQVEALSTSFDGLQDDVVKTRDDVAALMASMEDSVQSAAGMSDRLIALEANVASFAEVQAKVSTFTYIPLLNCDSYFSLSRRFSHCNYI